MTPGRVTRPAGPEERLVLLTFASLSWQKGSAAQVMSLVRGLRKVRPGLRFALLSHWPELDQVPARDLGIEVVGPDFPLRTSRNRRSLAVLFGSLRCAWWGIQGRVRPGGTRIGLDPVTLAYANSDFILDLSGDSYRDPPGGFAPAHNANFLAALAWRRPFAIASQSVGPFRIYNRWCVRYILKRAAAVYVRERVSARIVSRLGASADRVHLAPDLAFSLTAASPVPIWSGERLEPGRVRRPWIAVSVSELSARLAARRWRNSYLEEMTRLCEHIQARLGGTVFLVPHEIDPSGTGPDDRNIGREIRDRLKGPDWVLPLSGDYPPDCLKGFIGDCDALVAARMHAAIAGLSSGVPTIVVSWSHKYAGLMEAVGLEEFVWDQNRPSVRLPDLFDRLWQERHLIRGRLLEYTAMAQEQIAAVVDHLAQLVEPRSSPGGGAPA